MPDVAFPQCVACGCQGHDTVALAPCRPTMRNVRGGSAPMDAPITSRYHQVYARAQRDPEAFWAEAAQAIDWYEPPRKVFDPAAGIYGRWFVEGVCNTCFNAVDRHVAAGRAGQ